MSGQPRQEQLMLENGTMVVSALPDVRTLLPDDGGFPGTELHRDGSSDRMWRVAHTIARGVLVSVRTRGSSDTQGDEIHGLPDPVEGVAYLVSGGVVCAAHKTGRGIADLLQLGPTVKHDDNVMGYSGLRRAVYPPDAESDAVVLLG